MLTPPGEAWNRKEAIQGDAERVLRTDLYAMHLETVAYTPKPLLWNPICMDHAAAE